MFKVGDILKGNNNCGNELITFGLLKGKVLEVIDNEDKLIIEVLEHSNPDNIGVCFVESNSEDIFELLNKNTFNINIEDIRLLLTKSKNTELEVQEEKLSSLLEIRKRRKKNLAFSFTREIEIRQRIDELKINNSFKNELANKILNELKSIENDEKCKNIIISNNKINIFLNQWSIQDEDFKEKYFKVKECKIIMDLNYLEVEVFCSLKDSKIEDNYSEMNSFNYISESGLYNWGNIESMLIDSISNKELYTTFMLITNYLEMLTIQKEKALS